MESGLGGGEPLQGAIESPIRWCALTCGASRVGLTRDAHRMASATARFTLALRNERRGLKLSPSRPHAFVDKLLMNFSVGASQREEIKQWRGLQPGAFGYNESPTSSCHTFCWKARHHFDVPFF